MGLSKIGTPSIELPLNLTGDINLIGNLNVTNGNITGNFMLNLAEISWNSANDTYSRPSGLAASTQVVMATHLNMKRCVVLDSGIVNYYLDPINSNLKANGTASVLTGADGQVMVEIPAFYYRVITNGTVRTWSVSSVPRTGFILHPAFIKDGLQVAYRYYGAYSGSIHNGSVYESGLNYDNNWTAGQNWNADGANAKLSSVSGIYPAVGATRANFRSMANNRGSFWRQLDFNLVHAVQLLYVTEYGSFNSQTKLGDGNCNVSTSYPASSGNQSDSPHSVAGKSNILGNSSTNTSSGAQNATRDTAFMSYRGIENWYANTWEFVDGININNYLPYTTNNKASFADDTTTGYTSLGTTVSTSNGWATNFMAVDSAFLPSNVGGSSSSYIGDYYWIDTGWRVALFGGSANIALSVGAFCWSLNCASGGLNRNVGARIAG